MALGIGVVFVGYWVSLFGYCSLKGPGVGFVDLIVPGRLSGHVIPTGQGSGKTGGSTSLPLLPPPTPPPGSPKGTGVIVPPVFTKNPGETEPPLGPGMFGSG